MRLLFLMGLGALVGVALVSATSAAETDGPCRFTINGQDISGLDSSSAADAIPVSQNDTLGYGITASQAIVAYEASLSVGPYTRTVAEGQSQGGQTSVSDQVIVGDFTWLGVGMYKLGGDVTLADGSTCTGAVLFNVEGNPLTTVIGGSAAGATAVGALGIGQATVSGYQAASQAAGIFKP